MKKITVLVVVALVALFTFAACAPAAPAPASEAPASEAPASEAPASEAPASEAPASEAPAEGGDKLIIGYNAGTETLEFFNNVYGGIKDQAAKNNVELLYAVSNFDPEQILPKIETLLMQGANVIVDFNVNAEIGGNIVDIVKEKGGKGVIGIDVEYFSGNGTDRSWFMGANNQQAGELCGIAIADYVKANKDGKLEKLVLFFNSENGDEVKKRMGGAIDGLKKSGIELAEDQIEWIDLGGGGSDTTIAGKDKFTSWLTANPDVKSVGVVSVNDETMQGVLAAAETAGRADDVILASHNVSTQFIEQVKAGGSESWVGSVGYYPERYGEYIVPLAMDIFSGKNTDPSKLITMEHEFVTRAMVPDYEKAYNEYVSTWK